jgi:hypothetical protein
LDPKDLLQIRADSLSGINKTHNRLNLEKAGFLKGSKILRMPSDKIIKKGKK